jgi:hypothetical protein
VVGFLVVRLVGAATREEEGVEDCGSGREGEGGAGGAGWGRRRAVFKGGGVVASSRGQRVPLLSGRGTIGIGICGGYSVQLCAATTYCTTTGSKAPNGKLRYDDERKTPRGAPTSSAAGSGRADRDGDAGPRRAREREAE